MPNTANYAERWEPELLEILTQDSLISPFITTAVKWLSAKTFHFTQMSTSGYKSHNRNGGWNRGAFVQTDVPFTLTHDRDIEFLVDKLDVDETNATASMENISKTFVRTQEVPEANALFFSRVAGAGKEARRLSYRNKAQRLHCGQCLHQNQEGARLRQAPQIQGDGRACRLCQV